MACAGTRAARTPTPRLAVSHIYRCRVLTHPDTPGFPPWLTIALGAPTQEQTCNHTAACRQALLAGKQVIVLDLQEESASAIRNNKQIQDIRKTLQFQPFSNNPSLTKGLMLSVIELIRPSASAVVVATGGPDDDYWLRFFLEAGILQPAAEMYRIAFENETIVPMQELTKDDLKVSCPD